MPVVDQRYVEQFINRQTPEDAAWLSPALEPRALQQRRRRAQRDDAIRAALTMLVGEPNPEARLEELMAQQTGQRWAVTGDHMMVEAVRKVLSLNDGVLLRERQLRNIAEGKRTPVQ